MNRTVTFRLLAQCLILLHHRVHPSWCCTDNNRCLFRHPHTTLRRNMSTVLILAVPDVTATCFPCSPLPTTKFRANSPYICNMLNEHCHRVSTHLQLIKLLLLTDKIKGFISFIEAKRQQLNLRVKKYYWLIGQTSQLSVENKLLLYKTILKPIWTYGIFLWGCSKPSNTKILQAF